MYFEVTLAAFQKCVELNWFSKSENLVASKLRLILSDLVSNVQKRGEPSFTQRN